MGNLIWDHMRDDNTISEKLRDCARRLQAASFIALHALSLANPNDETEMVCTVSV